MTETIRPGECTRVLNRDGVVTRHADVPDAMAAVAGGVDAIVWVDLVAPTEAQLTAVARELGLGADLHPVLREDVFSGRRRPKIRRFDDHIFLDLVDVRAPAPGDDTPPRPEFDEEVGGADLDESAISAILFGDRVITVRWDARGFDPAELAELWTAAEPGRRDGVGFVLHHLLDVVVDHIVSVTEALETDVDDLEQRVVDKGVDRSGVQADAFTIRKSTSAVRRVAVATREVVAQVLRRDGRGFLTSHISDETIPYLHDVGDHVIRVSESLDALRDELTSMLELNMSLQDTELNQVMKKLSAWAAIIAVPTLITGYFGQNVPYPGFGRLEGLVQAVVLIVLGAVGLWWWFRRVRWL